MGAIHVPPILSEWEKVFAIEGHERSVVGCGIGELLGVGLPEISCLLGRQAIYIMCCECGT